jgi:acyl-CoA thioester hydrolase
MLRSLGGNYRQMEESGLLFVVVKATCLYHKPARYDDHLTIRVRVSRVTPAKLEHEYVVWRDHEKLATGHVTLALVDREGNIQRVPQWLRSFQ